MSIDCFYLSIHCFSITPNLYDGQTLCGVTLDFNTLHYNTILVPVNGTKR